MLLGTDLKRLKGLLWSPLDIEGATVSSVVSPVVNIHGLDIEQFQSAMIDLFNNQQSSGLAIHEVGEDIATTEDLEANIDELASWEWTFGKGPNFRVRLANRTHLVERGRTIDDERFDTELLRASLKPIKR